MQLVYSGAHPEVVVDEFDPETVITAGEPVEIPDDLAARLLEQDTWALAKASSPSPASSSAPIATTANAAPSDTSSTKASS